jgi:hypothetical protein
MRAEVRNNGSTVHINHIVAYKSGQGFLVTIDTDEKWPYSRMEDLGGGADAIAIVFFEEEPKGASPNDPPATVAVIHAEDAAEKSLFEGAYVLKELSSRYGRSFLITPRLTDEEADNQLLLYSAPCEGCDGDGVRAPAAPSCTLPIPDGWIVVERCDSCQRYADDVQAAKSRYGEVREVLCNDTRSPHAIANPASLLVSTNPVSENTGA